jgi:hypothetical protein
MEPLDILIMGSSRPKLIPIFWKSVEKMCCIRRPVRVFYHEDWVFPEESKKVEEVVRNLIPDVHYFQHKPRVGLGPAMDYMIKQHIKSKYMFYLQEDWEFEQPVDIDRILWMMDRNDDVNLVFFNKYITYKSINKFPQEHCRKDNVDLCLYPAWTFMPGLWRMPFVRPKWRTRYQNPEAYFTQVFDNRNDPQWCRKNMGAYIYGRRGEHRYVRHLGNSWRMASWRQENGHPGGMIEWDVQDLPFKPPWHPLTPDVPLNKAVGVKEERFIKMLREEPPEIQEALKDYLEIYEKKGVGRRTRRNTG